MAQLSLIVRVSKNCLGCLLKTQISSPCAQKLGFTVLKRDLDLCLPRPLDKKFLMQVVYKPRLFKRFYFRGKLFFVGDTCFLIKDKGDSGRPWSRHQNSNSKKVTLPSQPYEERKPRARKFCYTTQQPPPAGRIF